MTFCRRNAIYKDLWKKDNLERIFQIIGHKGMRVVAMSGEVADDCDDAINYAVFAKRLAVGGEAPDNQISPHDILMRLVSGERDGRTTAHGSADLDYAWELAQEYYEAHKES